MALQRIAVGQLAHPFTLTDLAGRTHTLQDYRGRHLLLSLYRSPDCALCSLRIYQLGLVYPRLNAIGLDILAVFEAESATIERMTRRHPPPFPMIADPRRILFALYDVRATWWALIGTFRLRSILEGRKNRISGSLTTGRTHQLPADILIGPDGRVEIAFYGKNTGDHLSLAAIEARLTAQPALRS